MNLEKLLKLICAAGGIFAAITQLLAIISLGTASPLAFVFLLFMLAVGGAGTYSLLQDAKKDKHNKTMEAYKKLLLLIR